MEYAFNEHERLTLLEDLSLFFPQVSLKNVCIIGVQHILPTTFQMLNTLIDKGLDRQNIHLIGKCYSTNHLIYDLLCKSGINVCPSSIYYDSHMLFDEMFQSNVKSFVKSILKKVDVTKFDKIILMDEGGYLIKLFQKFYKNLDNVIALEQTSSGYNKIKNLDVHFPIINVARSDAKLIHESTLVAEGVVENICKKIKKLKALPKKVLIIGKGSIGVAVENELKKIYEKLKIHFYDNEKPDHFLQTKVLKDVIGNYDLIIGCTGKTVLLESEYKYLKEGVILASASSSDYEFSGGIIRKKIEKNNNCHMDILFNTTYLLNSGFPINFSDNFELVDSPKFQLTRALLATAIYQGIGLLHSEVKGIIPLNASIQKKILKKFLEL
jgi:S-adenosylhomocysteine hydrolase